MLTIVTRAISEALWVEYGLRVDRVAPLPGGYLSRCYQVWAGGERYALKVWRDGEPRPGDLLLTERLHEHGLPVPRPRRTLNGALVAASPLGPLCLLSFLPGATPPAWPDWPPAVLEDLGATLARVHAATGSLGDAVPPRDGYDLPPLGAVPPWLRDEWAAQLDRLAALRPSPVTEVLCHTDLAGDNILVDESGRVALLDWELAALAAPEYDLALIARDQPATGEPLAAVLRGYRRAGGDALLSADRVAFFMLRRYLLDAAGRIERILDPATPDAARQEALDQLMTWGVRQWRRLDRALVPVRAVLDRQ